jgi:hypothetical protein
MLNTFNGFLSPPLAPAFAAFPAALGFAAFSPAVFFSSPTAGATRSAVCACADLIGKPMPAPLRVCAPRPGSAAAPRSKTDCA